MELHIVASEHNVQNDHCSVPLDELARQIRAGLELARRERCNALHHDLDIGDALLEPQARVSSGWKRWLRENCFLSVRTALLYQRLARHRAEIEAEIERVGELSLRAAVRLLTTPTNSTPRSAACWIRASNSARSRSVSRGFRNRTRERTPQPLLRET